MILIGNINNRHHRIHRCPIYVGRPSSLGNPYTVDVFSREDSIKRYREWLEREYENNERVKFMVDWIKLAEDNFGEVMLLCHCYPEPCHAEVIKKFIGDK